MNTKFLLLIVTVAALSSCTSSYKSSQTPDDVYFSPTRAQEEYVRTESKKEPRYRSDEYYDDRFLRMKVNNRNRWNEFNEWYGYERYSSAYNFSYNDFYNPYTSWNHFYNPYFYSPVVIYRNTSAFNRPRFFNMNTYNQVTTTNKGNNNMMRNNQTRYNNGYVAPRNSTRSSNAGNVLREVFSGGNNTSTNSNSNSNSNSPKSNTSNSNNNSSTPRSAPVRKF